MVKFSNANKQSGNVNGSALTILLLIISMMLLTLLTLNKVLISQERAINNYTDYELAENTAQRALLIAESQVLDFDVNNHLESTSIDARIYLESHITPNNTCNNNGWCYSSSKGWTPWTQTDISNKKPCNSYSISKTQNNVNQLPWIDQATSSSNKFQLYQTKDLLCSAPRYMLEFINPNFIGHFVVSQDDRNEESGYITQLNGVQVLMYKSGREPLPTARLYRITVRAFGKNGNTRVMLQEYVAITHRSNNSVTSSDIVPISIRWLK